MGKTVLKICCGEWQNASRDKRELSVCRELGANVLVMAKGKPTDCFTEDKVSGFDVLRFSTRPLGTKLPNSINRAVSIFTWAHYARKIRPDIISGHNINGLSVGWLSNIFRNKKAVLIYDSHEFEIGRNIKRNKLQRWIILHLERFLIKRCAFSVMVNDCIADEVQKLHHLQKRPIVVRNTPDLWTVNEAVTKEIRRSFCQALNVPKETFILMYHGGLKDGRGIETLIDVIGKTENTVAVILGNGEEKYLNSLKERAEKQGISDRVMFHSAVPIDVLWQYVGAADVGMILTPAVVLNHLYSLPNKFFENIQSETPIVCPFFPAMKPIVEQYGIGLCCDPENMEEILACVEKMRGDRAFYAQCKENLKSAKQSLCWEREKNKLMDAYSSICN